MQTIMLATDFSERSDRALRRATLLAKQSGASMSLVHVIDDDQPHQIVENERAEAEKLIHALAATLRSVDGVVSDTRVVLAPPFAGIVAAVEEVAPDLLVVGPHRRQLLRDVFVGTTAERTIRAVTCPVLMVNAAPVGPYSCVLQTTDLSAMSRRALHYFAGLGFVRDARQIVLHVFDAPALRLVMAHTMSTDERARYLEEERNGALRALAEFVAETGNRDAEQVVRYQANPVADEILMAAQQLNADLIVVANHRRSGFAQFFLGSVSTDVLGLTERDVLVVPPYGSG